MTFRRFLIALLGTSLISSLFAAAPGGSDSLPFGQFNPLGNDSGRARISVVSESNPVAAGKPFTVALKMEHPGEWHSYWHDPKLKPELPVKFEWVLPEGFKAGPVLWSKPEKIKVDGKDKYSFSGTAYHLTEITPPASFVAGQKVAIKVKADFQICNEASCMPQTEKAELAVEAGAEAKPDEELTAIFTAVRDMQPEVDKLATQLGILKPGQAGLSSDYNLPLLVLFAFIGGLILNLMPCVFPVIGIKIMGFVKQAGEDRAKIRLHGLVYTGGIIISLWLLSGLMFVLRMKGQEVGWGLQFQNAWFVYSMALLMFVFGLNMYGVFEIGTSAVGVGQGLSSRKGLSGAFFSGVLAVVVSTPCSAPFLASALGATATLPAVPFFAIFTFIGLGLALPYLLLSCFPQMIRKLPKPGPWMEAFKQIMSLLLFGTAGFMIWVYGDQVDQFNHLLAILGLAVIALGFYIYGRWATPVKEKSTRIKALAFAVPLAILGGWMGYPKIDPIKWEPWSEARVEELLDDDTAVYVDFTAKWCVTCQTNKSAYKSDKIYDLIKKKKVVFLRADWTDSNPAITRALNSFGKNAVPYNIIYIPGEEEPIPLNNLLTTDHVAEMLQKAPDNDEKSSG